MNIKRILLHIILIATSINCWGQNKLTADDYYIEAIRYFASNDMIKCEQMLDKCLKLEPEYDAALYYKGLVALEKSDLQTTLKYLSEACRLSPENYWYNIIIARLYSYMDEPDMAISIYEKLIAQNPNKSSLYYDIIELYGESEKYDKALEVLDQIEQIKGGRDFRSASLRFELLSYNNDQIGAISFLESYYLEHPTPNHAYILGRIALSSHNDTTARRYFNEALELDESFDIAHSGLADASLMTNDISQYFEHLNILAASQQIDPITKLDCISKDLFQSRYLIEFPQSDSVMNNLYNVHPTDTIVLCTLGDYYLTKQETQKGLNFHKLNSEINPDSEIANQEYLRALLNVEEYETILTQYEKLPQQFRDNLIILEALGNAYIFTGKSKNAIETYKKISELLPDEHEYKTICYSIIGDIYHTLDQNSTAYKYYEMALERDPNMTSVLNNYAYYLSLERRNLKKALQMSRKSIDIEPNNSTYLDTYGWILYLTGDLEGAKKYLKQALVYGGKTSAVIIDHYAEVLFALGEYDLAFMYWSDAHKLSPTMGFDKKIEDKKRKIKR